MGYQDLIIDHLVDQGLLNTDAAEDLRLSYGDEAATRLVTTGLIDEEQLLEQLAVRFEHPPAGYANGLFVQRQVFERLDTELIREYEILPVRRRGTDRVDVVVVEPLNDMALPIIEQCYDTEIRQYIWPRARFIQARHFFLGDELPKWIRPYLREHPVTLGYATPEGELDVHRALENSRSLHVHQWELDDVRRFVDDCYDRDTLLKVLVGFAGRWLTNRLVVVFVKEGIQPYFVEDWPELTETIDELDELRAIRVDTADSNLLRRGDGIQSGDSTRLGLTPLWEALGVSGADLQVALPIQLGGRTAMSLIGVPVDRDTGVRLESLDDQIDLEPLQMVTNQVGTQLEELIRRAKNDTLPPPAERIPPLPEPRIRVGLGIEDSLVEQAIASRQQEQGHHRWKIVDISHVIEESSAAEESSVDEAPSVDEESSVVQEVSGAKESSVVEETAESDAPTDDSEQPEEVQADPEDGDIAVASDELTTGDSVADESVVDAEIEEPSSVVDVVAQALDADDSSISETSEPGQDTDDRNGDSEEENVLAQHKDRPGSTTFGMPTVNEEIPSSGVLDDSASSDAEISEPSDADDEQGTDEKSVIEPADSAPEDDGAEQSGGEGDESSEDAGPDDPQEDVPEHKPERVDQTDQRAPVDAAKSSAGLAIPTSPSGVPMAQILRRPPSATQLSEASAPTDTGDERSESDANSRDDEVREPITGRTMMGLGSTPVLEDDDGDDGHFGDRPKVEDDDQGAGDDAEPKMNSSSAEGLEADSRPAGTLQMDADAARTNMFGELLDDMESDHIDESSAADHQFEQRPSTIPLDAIEEVEPGPMAVEIEESLSLIDSNDPDKAYAAAEHLATAGDSVLPKLAPLFPGPLFVDRYQYTVETMPPVNEHGPVLETLVRIGEASLAVVNEHIDDASLDRRFYATYLLTELPAYGLLEKVRQRLFDRDRQTRTLARNIVFAHRHLDDFEHRVVAPLRKVLEESSEDVRVEVAADNLRRFKDIASVPLLMEHLSGHGEKVRDQVHQALREITLQSLAPSPSEWRRWWFDADGQSRWQWLVDAMNSDDEQLRLMAFDEIEQLPGVDIDYHPEQPSKLRARAQKQLTEIFESQR